MLKGPCFRSIKYPYDDKVIRTKTITYVCRKEVNNGSFFRCVKKQGGY